uniref:RING-type domain-containing protein n=1 Tax=Wuchereria bancrofti TaxID=6293 RepID=A0AAF5Q825_WUCBA
MSRKPTLIGDEYKILLKTFNPYITCLLCKVLYRSIEATAVTGCSQTFCKSCLLKYFENINNCCPKCRNLIHQSHLSHYVSFDRTMQKLIYKLPGAQIREEENQNAFLRTLRIGPGENGPPEKLEIDENTVLMGKHHHNDEQVAVELCTDKFFKFSDIEMPYLRLSVEMATVNMIKQCLAITLFRDINQCNDLDIFCNNELMGRDYSMKFIEKTSCRNKPKDIPIKLLFRKHRFLTPMKLFNS